MIQQKVEAGRYAGEQSRLRQAPLSAQRNRAPGQHRNSAPALQEFPSCHPQAVQCFVTSWLLRISDGADSSALVGVYSHSIFLRQARV
jgi:hypothetical protein